MAVIVELAKDGATLDLPDKNGTIPTYPAAFHGQLEALIALENHGVELNTENQHGMTLLHAAAEGGSIEVLSFLAKKYASLLSKPDKNGMTPAYYAAEMGHSEFIAELAKHVEDIDIPLTTDYTLFQVAAMNGHLNVIKELSRLNVQSDASTNNRVTPLFLAAQNGHETVVRYLLDKPNLQNIPYISTASALTDLANKHDEDIKYKMDILINLSSKDPKHISVTPEQIAYIMGNDKVIKELRSKVDHDYMQLLCKLSNKQKDLMLRGEHKATQAASELKQKLTTSILQYYSGPKNHQRYNDFSASCTLAIAKARPVLEKHRRWKDFLAIIATAVLSLGFINIGLAAAHKYKTGRFSFRMFKTTSVELVEDIEAHITQTKI